MNNSLTLHQLALLMESMNQCMEEFDKANGYTSALVNGCQLNKSESLPLRFMPISLDKVVVKPSKIHGRGVFSKIEIKKGDLITLYPCHVLDIIPCADRHLENHVVLSANSDVINDRFGKDWNKKDHPLLRDYAFNYDDFHSLVGHPQLDDNPSYLGHLINDAAKPTSDPRSHSIYELISQSKMNCLFVPIKGWMVTCIALRDIEVGEELLVSYGLAYWKCRIENQHSK